MVWTVDEIPDQSGRVALVTGANSGLGLETTKALFRKGALVIMGSRSISKAQASVKELVKKPKSGIIDFIELDLADLTNVNEVAKQIEASYGRLDLLINNAGLMAPPRRISKQGLEIQFAVNHLSHMALTLRLLPLLVKGHNSRVVTVSSGAQYIGKISWDDLQGVKRYDRWASYSQSKLANLMFALELDNRLRGLNINVASLAAHPGLARTNLQPTSVAATGSWLEAIAYKLMGPIFQSAKMGSLPQLMAATSLTAKGGEQYGPHFNFRGYPTSCRIAPLALQRIYRERLWAVSEKLIRDIVDVSYLSTVEKSIKA